MFEAVRFQLPYDFGRFPGHLLDNRAFDRGEIKRTAAQHNAVNVGVYASVVSGGTIHRGDPVTLT